MTSMCNQAKRRTSGAITSMGKDTNTVVNSMDKDTKHRCSKDINNKINELQCPRRTCSTSTETPPSRQMYEQRD